MKLVPFFARTEVPTTTRLLEEFFSDLPFHGSVFEGRDSWTPSVDIMEKEGNLVLRAELPGLTEKQIELKLEGNTLTLRGERKMEDEDNKGTFHRVESFYGTFTRSFRLPDTVDAEKINAEYKNGVLTVTIPQKPEVRPREIPVSVH